MRPVSILSATSAKNVEWPKDYITEVFVISFAAGSIVLQNCYAIIVQSNTILNKTVFKM